MSPVRPIGVVVILYNEKGQVLLGLRPKEGLWASFGGALELGESINEGAMREILEELGLVLVSFEWLSFGEGMKQDGTRYVSLYLKARLPEGQVPVLKEPDRVIKMGWFDVAQLPENMWPRERAVIQQSI